MFQSSETLQPEEDRYIGEAECARISNISRATRWRLQRKGLFPPRREISPGRIAWLLSEVIAWRDDRPTGGVFAQRPQLGARAKLAAGAGHSLHGEEGAQADSESPGAAHSGTSS